MYTHFQVHFQCYPYNYNDRVSLRSLTRCENVSLKYMVLKTFEEYSNSSMNHRIRMRNINIRLIEGIEIKRKEAEET